MSKIYVVTSGKGGVGKTSVSVFLGAKLAERGKRTVVCDLDFGLNNLDIVMGVEDKVVYDLTDAIEGRCRAGQSLVESTTTENLFMISSAHALGKGAITGQNIRLLFEGLKDAFDYVILDCPAGIDVGFHRAVSSCDEAILVITPNLSCLRDADKVLSVLRSYKINVSAIVNKVRGDLMFEGQTLNYSEIENLLKVEIIGAVPEDDNVLLNKNSHLPNSTVSGRAFYQIADNIINKKKKIKDYSKIYSGFFGSIRRSLKKII